MKSLLYEFELMVFSFVAYIVMLVSVASNNSFVCFILSFLYVFPKTIICVNEIEHENISKKRCIIDTFVAIIGAIISIFSLVMLSLGSEILNIGFCKCLIIVLSSAFCLKDSWSLFLEFKKYINFYNVQNNDIINEKKE